MHKRILPLFILALLTIHAACDRKPTQSGSRRGGEQSKPQTLMEARSGFQTRVVSRQTVEEPVAQPPANLFNIVKYQSAAGELPAYLSVAPKDGKKHPAMLWITGGDSNSIGD